MNLTWWITVVFLYIIVGTVVFAYLTTDLRKRGSDIDHPGYVTGAIFWPITILIIGPIVLVYNFSCKIFK
jgi:hypothetical protein